jgi:hypothetical protein
MKIGVYTVTPENEICCKCKKKKCVGDCKEYRDFIKAEKSKGKKAKKRNNIKL